MFKVESSNYELRNPKHPKGFYQSRREFAWQQALVEMDREFEGGNLVERIAVLFSIAALPWFLHDTIRATYNSESEYYLVELSKPILRPQKTAHNL